MFCKHYMFDIWTTAWANWVIHPSRVDAICEQMYSGVYPRITSTCWIVYEYIVTCNFMWYWDAIIICGLIFRINYNSMDVVLTMWFLSIYISLFVNNWSDYSQQSIIASNCSFLILQRSYFVCMKTDDYMLPIHNEYIIPASFVVQKTLPSAM